MMIIAARIRRMTGSYVFTGVCLFNFRGGDGVPTFQLTRGGEGRGRAGGYLPSSQWGVPTFQPTEGLPSFQPMGGGGAHLPADWEVPTFQPMGGGGTYLPANGQGRYPPPSPHTHTSSTCYALAVCVCRSRRKNFLSW